MQPRTILPIFLIPLGVACGGSSSASPTPWQGNTAKVVDSDGDVTETAAGSCAKLASGECLDTADKCGEGASADVYLDEKGEVASVVCYPKEGVTEVLDGTNSLPEGVDNKDFIVLEGDAENPAFSGDLDLSGNNSTLYGEDPTTSILDGNLAVSKNNVLVSGITVTGNVVVTFNDANFTRCIIEGDLEISGNNAIVAGCHIKGNVIVSGTNTELTANRIDGNIELEGASGIQCTNNYRGESLDEGELLECK